MRSGDSEMSPSRAYEYDNACHTPAGGDRPLGAPLRLVLTLTCRARIMASHLKVHDPANRVQTDLRALVAASGLAGSGTLRSASLEGRILFVTPGLSFRGGTGQELEKEVCSVN